MSTRVLVIEDNPANMELMAYLLEAFGHTALRSTDGEQGVEMARREVPDLIICDVHLPKMDGYGVVKVLKANPALAAIPVVAVTALAMVGDREKVMLAGFDAYIGKPIDPETFVAQVEKLIAEDKRSPGLAQAEAAATVATAPPTQQRASVLVVDDSEVNSELIHSTLTPFGYQVSIAHTVTQALALARSTPFDMILSDLHMPEHDGFSFLASVKADPALAHLPFMFLSSSFGSSDDFRRGAELGATVCVRRPLEPQALLVHIEKCLNGTDLPRTDEN